MLAAMTMAQTAIVKVATIRDSFKDIKTKAIEFANTVNANMDIDDDDMLVQEEIPSRRVGRKKTSSWGANGGRPDNGCLAKL